MYGNINIKLKRTRAKEKRAMNQKFYKVIYESNGEEGYFYMSLSCKSTFLHASIEAMKKVENHKFSMNDKVVGLVQLKREPKDKVYYKA